MTRTAAAPSPTVPVPVLRFRPTAEGLARWFGFLEAEIMAIVWANPPGAAIAVSRVHREIAAGRDLAYTTVMTTMGRLAEKGVLQRRRDGLAYVYTAACTREEFEEIQIRAIVASLEITHR